MRVIGFDPGLVTGVCSVVVDGEEIRNVEHHQLDHMAVGHFMEQIYKDSLTGQTKPLVVVESFIITPQTGKNSQAPWSLETIGIIRWFCGRAGIDPVFQTPAAAKRLASDDVLKAAGMHARGQGHATDAARHVFLYLATELKVGREALLS